MIDNCTENLLREGWGFSLFKMEGKQYLYHTMYYSLWCYKWRLQRVFKCFLLLIILKSTIKISILGYRACGLCFPLGWRGSARRILLIYLRCVLLLKVGYAPACIATRSILLHHTSCIVVLTLFCGPYKGLKVWDDSEAPNYPCYSSVVRSLHSLHCWGNNLVNRDCKE